MWMSFARAVERLPSSCHTTQHIQHTCTHTSPERLVFVCIWLLHGNFDDDFTENSPRNRYSLSRGIISHVISNVNKMRRNRCRHWHFTKKEKNENLEVPGTRPVSRVAEPKMKPNMLIAQRARVGCGKLFLRSATENRNSNWISPARKSKIIPFD